MGGLIRSSLGVLSPKINQRTTMKAVFALLLVCLSNLFCGGTRKYWQRRKSFAAKGSERCCKRKNTTMSRRNVQTGMKKNRQRNPKKGGKGRKGRRTAKGEPKRKRPGK